MAFQRVTSAADLWNGEMTSATVDGTNVLLLRIDDTVYAFENRCAHLGVPLAEGRLDRCVLTCRAHGWQYDPRSGKGINPTTAVLRRFAVKNEGEKIFVDVQQDLSRGVGPVLISHPSANAMVDAIRRLNPSVEVLQRGSYIRILAPQRCLLTRRAVEDVLGQPFDMRCQLETLMPSFQGRLHLGDDEAVWTQEDAS
jgi:toluene monooxygenase system ferredoxin subunit